MFSLRDSENDLFSGSDYGLRAGVPFLSPSRAPKFPLPLPFLTPATQAIHSRKLSSTRRWAIDSDGVARLVEISSAVKVVLLAMCFLVFAFCLVGCSSTWALWRFSAEPKWYLLLCYTLLWFKRHCLGIPPVRWPFMMQLMHILSCQLDLSNRPRLVKSSIPNFKIKTVNWSLRQKD